MGRSRGRRRPRPPVTVTLDRLEAKHTSGLADDGRRFKVRGAGVGAVVSAQPGKKGTARRLALVEPAPDAVEPRCPLFGVCGGCQLQEMPVDRQAEEKSALVARLTGVKSDEGHARIPGVAVHAPRRAAGDGYAYRNKIELSWGPVRFTPEGIDRSEVQTRGAYLGFHPPGWFSKVVPVPTCPLASDAMNRVVERVQSLELSPAWDTRAHTGVWRHLVVRDGGTPEEPQVLVTFVTTSEVTEEAMAAAGAAVAELDGVTGVLHVINDGVAEVARGELKAVLHGRSTLDVTLGAARLNLPYDGFFQVNPAGAEVLVATIAEALGLREDGVSDAVLVDLYCGAGAIGLALSDRVERLIGVEVHEGAVACASANATAMGVSATFLAGQVEAVVPQLELGPDVRFVVDPPRAGLHPKAARFLAAHPAELLVYVACGPASLGRDREVLEAGGWQLTDLWTVDLFPQTHHIEAVARFVRPSSSST